MKGYGYQWIAAPRIRVKASQQNGNSNDSTAMRAEVSPRGPNATHPITVSKGTMVVHELVAELVDAVEVQHAGQRDVVDDAGEGDRDQPDQPERLEYRRGLSRFDSEQQGGRADDEVGQDGEEREGVEPAGDGAVEVPGGMGRGIDAQRDPGRNAERRGREPGPGPSGRHAKIVLAARRGIEPSESASRPVSSGGARRSAHPWLVVATWGGR